MHPVPAVLASGAAVVHLPVVDPLLRVVRAKVRPWLHATWLVATWNRVATLLAAPATCGLAVGALGVRYKGRAVGA